MSDVNPKQKAWSISRLQTFETCPRQYWHLNIKRDVKFVENEYSRYGKDAHSALERRLRDGIALPNRFKQWEGMCKKIESQEGELFCEREFTLNENMKPTGWFDADAYIRVKADVVIIKPCGAAWVGDYKTGKMKDNDDQLKLTAAVIFTHYPEIMEITASFIWLKDNKVTKTKFRREELSDLWSDLLPRAGRIEQAIIEDNWPPRVSGLCNWCGAKQQGKCDVG